MVIGTSRCAHVLRYLFCCRAPSVLNCSTTADVSGEPVMRSARPKARRRIAARRHCWWGCSHAPRPGRVPAVSTVTANSPFPVGTATTRSSSTASSCFRHPMQVRTGPAPEAEVSRWITRQSTSQPRRSHQVPDVVRRAADCSLSMRADHAQRPTVYSRAIEDFNAAGGPVSSGQARIQREKRRVERFGQGHVEGIPASNRCP